MLEFLVDEIYIIYVVIIMKIAVVRFFAFLKIFLNIFLKILEMLFESIILIRFNRFLVLIVENTFFYYIFENLINFLLRLKLKMRSRIVLRSRKI